MRLNFIKNIFNLAIFAALALSFFLSSCNEDPTSLGYSLVKDTVELVAVNTDDYKMIANENTYFFPLNFINPGFSLIGRTSDTKSGVLMRFGNIPDSLGYLTESDIVSSEITLTPHRYALGDTATSNSLSFGIHEVNKSWVLETPVDEFFAGSLYESSPFASFSGSLARKDTMDKITLAFKKSLAVDWFKKQAGKIDTVWGIALVPDAASTIINQFYGSGGGKTNEPILTVIYNDKNNKLDTLILRSSLEKNFSQGPKPADDRLVVQGALSYRTRLDFDISFIPKFAGIHKAELQLTLDTTQSFSGNFPLDTILRLDYFNNFADELAGNKPIFYYAGRREPGSNKFIVPSVTSALTYWNRRNGQGTFTVGFENALGQYRLNKLSFYKSDNPDPNKRPKLIVIYSVLNKKENE